MGQHDLDGEPASQAGFKMWDVKALGLESSKSFLHGCWEFSPNEVVSYGCAYFYSAKGAWGLGERRQQIGPPSFRPAT